MADPPSTEQPQREPDVALLVALIAFACLATMGTLALVLTAPAWVVCVSTLVPITLWALLLRHVHGFLRTGEPDDAPSWTRDVRAPRGRRRSGEPR